MSLGLPTLLDSGTWTSGNGFTSASVSGSANELLIVAIGVRRGLSSPTITGSGLTFTQQSEVDAGDGTRVLVIYRSQLTGSFSGTIAFDSGTNQDNAAYAIMTYSGQTLGGTNGSNAFVQTLTEFQSPASSPYVKAYAAFASPSNGCLAIGYSEGATYTSTPRSGWTTIVQPTVGGVLAFLVAAKVGSDTQAEQIWGGAGAANVFTFTSFEISAVAASYQVERHVFERGINRGNLRGLV